MLSFGCAPDKYTDEMLLLSIFIFKKRKLHFAAVEESEMLSDETQQWETAHVGITWDCA